MKVLTHVPEVPINEEWAWNTDVQVSDNGTETRICLRDEPKRTVSTKYVFTDEGDLRSARGMVMAALDRPFLLPFYQHATRLTAPAAIGALRLQFDASRTELRPLGAAIVFDRAGRFELATVAALDAAGADLGAPLGKTWGRGTSIAPLYPVHTGPNATFARYPLNGATFGLSAFDTDFMVPFLNPLNDAPLTLFAGLPVVPYNAIGDTFDEGFANGSTSDDYGGIVHVRTPWTFQQLTFTRTYLCNRTFDRPSWQWWNKFADYCKGSWQPFYVPTFREDFGVFAPPLPNGNTLTFEGWEYAEDFAPYAPFQQFAIFTRAGVHYASVTACVKVGANSKITFAPALPNGADWGKIDLVSLLLKARISDDKLTCEHGPVQTKIGLNFRTVMD